MENENVAIIWVNNIYTTDKKLCKKLSTSWKVTCFKDFELHCNFQSLPPNLMALGVRSWYGLA